MSKFDFASFYWIIHRVRDNIASVGVQCCASLIIYFIVLDGLLPVNAQRSGKRS